MDSDITQPAIIPLTAVRLIDECIVDAFTRKASDIHLDPDESGMRIRFRIDGTLSYARYVPQALQYECISRLKVLAGLRTDEHQSSQDGRFRFNVHGSEIDIRISIVPTYFGENAVLRLLTPTTAQLTLEELGAYPQTIATIEQALAGPAGLIIATGPTGSGKTTTLYALMQLLQRQDLSLATIEDPIEYVVPGICQMESNLNAGISLASGLRALLRQDPDVLMVGEIRDAETARIAIHAALTGHIVLTTMHTADSVSALPRLIDLGIDPYLIASTLRLVIAERLVRRICEACDADGCSNCHESGYSGRIGVFELFPITPPLVEAIHRRAPIEELRELGKVSGLSTLMADGLRKVADARTSIEEIRKITYDV